MDVKESFKECEELVHCSIDQYFDNEQRIRSYFKCIGSCQVSNFRLDPEQNITQFEVKFDNERAFNRFTSKVTVHYIPEHDVIIEWRTKTRNSFRQTVFTDEEKIQNRQFAIQNQVDYLNSMLSLEIHPSSTISLTGYRDALLSGALNGHGGQYFIVESGVALLDSFCDSFEELSARRCYDFRISSYFKIPGSI